MKDSPVLITDLGNVVVLFDRRKVSENLSQHIARSINEIDYILNDSEQGANLLKQLEIGKLKFDDYHREVGAQLRLETSLETFRECHNCLFTENRPVARLWKALHATGTVRKLVALSDTDPDRLAKMIKLSELNFDHVVASFMVETRKTDSAGFREALRLSDAEPNDCIYVDDRQDYVDIAKNLGMIGIRYEIEHPEAFEHLCKNLRQYLPSLDVVLRNPEEANASQTRGWIVGHMCKGLANTQVIEIKRWHYPRPFEYGWKEFGGTEYFSVYGGELEVNLKFADGTFRTTRVRGSQHESILIPPGTKKQVIVIEAPAFGDTVRWPSVPDINTVHSGK